MKELLKRQGVKIVALAIMLVLYGAARLPTVPEDEAARLAKGFYFTGQNIPALGADLSRTCRDVHPDFERIAGWISSVGAAVAFSDLDGDGYPNDIVNVDTRTDLVIVAPAPGRSGRSERYAPFALEAAPLPYDAATMAPMGTVPGDFNEDGLADVLVYFWGRTPVIFLQRESVEGPLGAQTFVPRELVTSGDRWFTNAATSADVDGDGHVDLVIGNYFQDGAQVLDKHGTTPQRMQHSMSRALNAGLNRVFLWKHGASGDAPEAAFAEASGCLPEKVAEGWTLAVGARDLDGDLLPEIYFANDFGSDRLLHNRSTPGNVRFAILEGQWTWTTPRSKVLGHDSFKGMGVDFGDLNGDAIPDLFVSNIAAEYALEESHFLWMSTGDEKAMAEGRAPYRDAGEELGVSRSGWGWDTKLADLDNDGVLEALQATGFLKGTVNRWPELHEIAMGNDDLLEFPWAWHRFQPGDDLSGSQRNPFYVRSTSGRFVDVSDRIGMGDPQVTRGIAVADVNGDGMLDLAYGNQWEASRFYLNRSAKPGTFLGLNLLLPLEGDDAVFTVRNGFPDSATRGRFAIGAEVRVVRHDGSVLTGAVDGGNGHSGRRSPQVHFGLGKLSLKDQVKVIVRWRDTEGRARERTLHLAPGWHTILLAPGGEA